MPICNVCPLRSTRLIRNTPDDSARLTKIKPASCLKRTLYPKVATICELEEELEETLEDDTTEEEDTTEDEESKLLEDRIELDEVEELDVAQLPSNAHPASAPGSPLTQLVCDHSFAVHVTYSLDATQS